MSIAFLAPCAWTVSFSKWSFVILTVYVQGNQNRRLSISESTSNFRTQLLTLPHEIPVMSHNLSGLY